MSKYIIKVKIYDGMVPIFVRSMWKDALVEKDLMTESVVVSWIFLFKNAVCSIGLKQFWDLLVPGTGTQLVPYS